MPSPYTNYGNLNTVAAIISSAESSQAAIGRITAKGVSKDGYTVTQDPTGNTPELFVTATSAVPATAMTWDRIVTRDVTKYIYGFQNGSNATPSTFVTTKLVSTGLPQKSDKSRLRVGVAVGVVTVLLAISLTLIFDSMMAERSSRKRRATTLPLAAASNVGDGEFYTGGGSIASMHSADSRGRTSALRRP